MERVEIGSVHGRFQPFHNGHLDYVLQAFAVTDFVKIGLTQIFWPDETNSIQHRENANSNPLAYWERMLLIAAALEDAGIAHDRFEFVPFPIETPEKLNQFVDKAVVCFTTIVSDWNHRKIQILEENGYEVVVLNESPPDNNRVTSGSEIRKLIRNGDRTWVRFVPPVVSELITQKFIQRF